MVGRLIDYGRRKWLRLSCAAVGLALLIAAVWLLLALERIPPWYTPAVLDEFGIDHARRDATRMAATVSDLMVAGQPFDVTLTEDQINAWLTALPDISPQAARSMPHACRGLAVRLQEDQVMLCTHFDHDGWEAILTLSLQPHVSDDGSAMVFSLGKVYSGVVEAPRSVLALLFESVLDQLEHRATPSRTSNLELALRDVRSIDDLYRGLALPNRMTWPNGNRLFRIDAIHLSEGAIIIRIVPIR